MRGLKILSITPKYPDLQGAGYNFISNLVNSLAVDSDLVLLSLSVDDRLRSNYLIDHHSENNHYRINIKVKRGAGDYLYYLRFMRALYHGYRLSLEKLGGSPDLLYIHAGSSITSLRAGRFLSVISGKPYVITEYFSAFTDTVGIFETYSQKTREAFRRFFSRAEALVVPSLYLMEQLGARGLQAKDNRIIPLPVKIPDKPTPPPLFPPFRLVTVSNLVDRIKNIRGLLKAVKIVSEQQDVELHIVGTGEDEQSLKDYAHLLGLLDKKVFFRGYIPNNEVYSLINASHIFVLNSNFETFSLATAEALACGRPVVVTRCGGPEDFVNEKCGLLVNPGEPEEFARAVLNLIERYTSYNLAEIQEHARETFSMETVAARYHDLFEQITGSKQG